AFRRKGRGRANRVASLLTMLVGLGVALLVAGGMGVAAYALVGRSVGGNAALTGLGGAELRGALVLFILLATIYLTWATVPLSLGGGSQFTPGRMLLYPVSLRKLFALDLLSELTSLAAIFAMPAVCAIALGAGLASGNVGQSLVIAACALVFGVALAKLLSTCVGVLMQARRTRGEALLAFVGAMAAFTGVLFGQSERLLEGAREFPAVLRWTPPGAAALALAGASGANGAREFWFAVALLLTYAAAAILLAYWIAKRSLASSGHASGKRETSEASGARTRAALAGWSLPFASPQLSSIVEKELRYAKRNAQLRVMALMPLVLTLSFSLIGRRRGGGESLSWFQEFAPYMEGSRAALSLLYVFMIMSAVSGNLFAFEGGGMRTLVLSPVERRTILLGKNLAALIVAFFVAALVMVFNGLLYGDLTWRALLFATFCFVIYAVAFTLVGNWLSMRFPKRLQFGRRLNASGMTGLLLLPVLVALVVPPALSVWAGYRTESRVIVYVILAAFAAVAVASYVWLINFQGRALARRELDILEIVTGRDDD
ncbi:MAG: hypothetical protein M3371_06105, partial [Acidobacteriota bacterium]|nr:hypothetical protein [Acidobacteriota bacterium]